jgi:hypothetical protein
VTVTNQNFKVYRADTHVVHVDLTHADGTPFDPSINVQMRWRMTRNPADEDDAVIRKALLGEEGGITKTATGVDIALNGWDTDVPLGCYAHYLIVNDPPDVNTAMTGYAVIQRTARMGTGKSVLQGNLAISKTPPTRVP